MLDFFWKKIRPNFKNKKKKVIAYWIDKNGKPLGNLFYTFFIDFIFRIKKIE
jgi:hypothetical protein